MSGAVPLSQCIRGAGRAAVCAPAARGRGKERRGARAAERDRVVKLSIADGTALRCGRVGSRHFQKPAFELASLFTSTLLSPRRSAVPREPMCTACVVLVKRLRRTDNVRGTFEGVSAPREFAQPSLLSKHRTPYGSRHFRSPRGFIPRGLFVYVATRHRLPGASSRCREERPPHRRAYASLLYSPFSTLPLH